MEVSNINTGQLDRQVLGRCSPFPLILLPQFGGYWIEGTNHEPKDPPDTDQPPCPTTQIKLETNNTAKTYRKTFVGKVRLVTKTKQEIFRLLFLESTAWTHL